MITASRWLKGAENGDALGANRRPRRARVMGRESLKLQSESGRQLRRASGSTLRSTGQPGGMRSQPFNERDSHLGLAWTLVKGMSVRARA